MKIRKIEKSLGQWLDERGLEIVINGTSIFIGNETTGYAFITSTMKAAINYINRESTLSQMDIFPHYLKPDLTSEMRLTTKTIFFPRKKVFTEEEIEQLMNAYGNG